MDAKDKLVQQKLDDALAGSAEAQKYVSKVYYVPTGEPIPPDVTHQVAVASVAEPASALMLGVVCVPDTAIKVDQLLALLAA